MNLGPLLFILFTNDITETFNVPYLLYADDIKMIRETNSMRLCENLFALHRWC